MSAILGALILGLAARGAVATLRDLGRGVGRLGSLVGSWWRSLTLTRDKRGDLRRNGVVRLQSEVAAMAMQQAAEDRASLKTLQAEVEALRAESAARGNPADAGARGRWQAS